MAPFIEIDGRRFYADRPYLNCMAGCCPPPPSSTDEQDVQLFSRARLVASLAASAAANDDDDRLEAAILTTYTVDVPDLEQELPALFGSEGQVPTLLLHGDKCVRRGYHHQAVGPYRVWKEVKQEDPNVERPRGAPPRGPFWCYEAMDRRIQVCSFSGGMGGGVYGVVCGGLGNG